MNEPIKVGDLVMVVRWPHGCVNPQIVPGTPFTVGAIELLTGICKRCNRRYHPAGSFGARPHDSDLGRIPLAWLRKIDPPALPEDVEHKEELPA